MPGIPPIPPRGQSPRPSPSGPYLPQQDCCGLSKCARVEATDIAISRKIVQRSGSGGLPFRSPGLEDHCTTPYAPSLPPQTAVLICTRHQKGSCDHPYRPFQRRLDAVRCEASVLLESSLGTLRRRRLVYGWYLISSRHGRHSQTPVSNSHAHVVLAIRWAMIPKITIAHTWKQRRLSARPEHTGSTQKYLGQHDGWKMKGFRQPEIAPQTSHYAHLQPTPE